MISLPPASIFHIFPSAASAPRVTIVGEMAGLLCRDGNPTAAIQLERTWDDLTRGRPFLTVCSYPMELFSERGDPELFAPLCAAHWAVSHAHEA
jgi:hypothetical protein